MMLSSLNFDTDGSGKCLILGSSLIKGSFGAAHQVLNARRFFQDYVEAPKTIKVTIGIRGLNSKSLITIFKLRDGFKYKIYGRRGVVVTSMMWYPYTAPFSGNSRFANCFFFIKISGFYVGYVSSVNLQEVLTGLRRRFCC